jgi:Transposase
LARSVPAALFGGLALKRLACPLGLRRGVAQKRNVHDDSESGVPTADPVSEQREGTQVKVIIGVDPHKATHTAVALNNREEEIARVTVRATRRQLEQLQRWAAPFEERVWAIESAGGLGYLPAQQLVGAGEQVVDVPATLAARVRVPGTGRSNKNDPNDARSVAVAALRSPTLTAVQAADHAAVLRLLVTSAKSRPRTHPTPGHPRPRGHGQVERALEEALDSERDRFRSGQVAPSAPGPLSASMIA